jgi:hypothetical protein
MPEMNDVLGQAIREVESVTHAAEEAREGIKRLEAVGEALTAKLESHLRDSRASLAELAERLAGGGNGLQEAARGVLTGLRSLGSRHVEGEAQVEELVDDVHAGFADLGQGTERVLDAAEEQARAVESELAGFTERVQRLDADAETRFRELHVAIGKVTEDAEAMRRSVRERREKLLAGLDKFEALARHQLEASLDSFDAAGARLECQVADAVAALQGHADSAADVLKDRFEREGCERLVAAGAALQARIHAFEELAIRQRQRMAEQCRRVDDAGKDAENTCTEVERNVRLR